MEKAEKKCVMILDEELPAGVLANAAGILGMTLGKHIPEMIGPDVTDKNGRAHLGITAYPVPILKAGKDKLRQIREQLYEPDFDGCVAVDFSDVAQSCRTYEEFTDRAAAAEGESITYLGIGIWGTKKQVNRLTGSLPLLR